MTRIFVSYRRDDERHFVDLGIAQAQKTGKVILHVLIDNRPMPAWGSPPTVSAALGELQTFTVRVGRDHEPDARTLVRQIDGYTDTKESVRCRSWPS